MKENDNITKNQHYVPQFYLRKFANDEDKLEILDCERRKVVASRSPKSVCNEEYYYSANNKLDEVSQALEKEFQRIESDISKVYDSIAKKFVNFEQIAESDKMLVATFMSLQYLRGPYMRKQIQRMNEQMIKQITKLHFGSSHIHKFFDQHEKETGEKLTEQQRNEVIEFAQKGEYRVEMGNAAHLHLIGEMEGFRNLLFGKEWQVYISKSSKKFITSDNPVIELFPEWTGKFFYGPTFLQRTHQFSMTPDILIVATDPRNPPEIVKVKRKTLFDNKEHNEKILELNFQHPRNAIAYAYASSSDLLQDIVDSANLYDKQQRRAS
ncbi:MAG: DUF4238 domain-containing protein [Kiritimatiellia bacterium]|mgnify:FL=1|jgi:hypothetical protein